VAVDLRPSWYCYNVDFNDLAAEDKRKLRIIHLLPHRVVVSESFRCYGFICVVNIASKVLVYNKHTTHALLPACAPAVRALIG
jgi:hypothetical protein